MKIRYWFGILLAVPLACGQGLQKASRSVAYQPTSSEDFLNIISHIPPCALDCLATLIQHTACTFGDLPCMCADAEYEDASTICVRENCKISEALSTKNLTETACGRPQRDLSGQYTSMNIASGVVTAIIVAARLIFRRFFSGSGQIGLDDWVIVAAIIIGAPGMILNQVGLVGHGIGKDIWTLSPAVLPIFAKYFFIMEVIYIIEMCLVKLSLSLFYLYVFPRTKIRCLLIGTAIFNVIFGVVFVTTAMVQCIPLHYYWAQYYDFPPEGSCFDLNRFAWANAGLGLVVDLWMIILPMTQVRRLELHWKKKIGVILMFILGAFVSIISLLRLKSVIFFANLINPTWDQWNVAWWSTMEVNIGIICTCLPTVRLILKRMFPKILSTGDENGAGSGLSRGGDASPRGKAQTPAFSMELSTTTLVTEVQSTHKGFEKS